MLAAPTLACPPDEEASEDDPEDEALPDWPPDELPVPEPDDVEEEPPPSTGEVTDPTPPPPSVCWAPLATLPAEGTDTGSRGSVGLGADGALTGGDGTEGAETDGTEPDDGALTGRPSARLARGIARNASRATATTAQARAGRQARRRQSADIESPLVTPISYSSPTFGLPGVKSAKLRANDRNDDRDRDG